jgi:hypothetical protein
MKMRSTDLGSIATLAVATLAALSAPACEPIGKGSCDFPGECHEDFEPGPHHRSGEVVLRTVMDLDTGEVLCTACDGCTSVAARVGQRLSIEEQWMSVQAFEENHDGIEGVSFGCTADESSLELDAKVRAWAAAQVPALSCWRTLARRDSFRIVGMEVLPPEPGSEPSPFIAETVDGRGYRFEVEVLGPGPVGLLASGECEDFWDGRRIIEVVVPCAADGACPAPLICVDGDACGYPACGPEPERVCPAPLDCLSASCSLEACGANNPCSSSEECVRGVCRRLCGPEAPCTPPATCIEGACIDEGCSLSRPCAAPLECFAPGQGTCIRCESCGDQPRSAQVCRDQSACLMDCPETPCPAPLVCESSYCRLATCGPSGPWCPEGQACIGGYCALEPEG